MKSIVIFIIQLIFFIVDMSIGILICLLPSVVFAMFFNSSYGVLIFGKNHGLLYYMAYYSCVLVATSFGHLVSNENRDGKRAFFLYAFLAYPHIFEVIYRMGDDSPKKSNIDN